MTFLHLVKQMNGWVRIFLQGNQVNIQNISEYSTNLPNISFDRINLNRNIADNF